MKVVVLGDSNKKTLGFLPREAFKKYALKNQLIGAFNKNTDDLLGYLLYRVSYNKVTIVHCCIDEKYRNNNTAFDLITFLKTHTKQYEAIKLSCRNDYGIDSFWEKCNFVPIKEKKGRGKDGLPLTIWRYSHYQNNLLTQISEYEFKNKIVAVIDMNVFLDIKDNREEESIALKSDWLLGETILYFTREIRNEINRAKTLDQKETSRKLLNYFTELPFSDEERFSELQIELRNKFPLKDKNDRSDLNHLAYSISGGAQYFITRDKLILSNKKYFKQFNLEVCRPIEFITTLDETIQVTKYQPQNLIGTTISSARITSENIDLYTDMFLKPSERKIHFQKVIRKSLSLPNEYELLTISKEDVPLAFVVFDRTIKNTLKIPVFRFLNTNLRTTLSKHLLFKSILTSIQEKRMFIEIREEYLEDDIIQNIKEARFVQRDEIWRKINIDGILNTSEVQEEIFNEPNGANFIGEIISNIKQNYNANEGLIKKYHYERYFSPLKIKDLEIPCFIIPIKPHWAEELFNDKSVEKLDLFEPKYDLLLNRENVYYRSARPKILNAPARILWYSSEKASSNEKGSIVAASYLDEIFIDNPKKLYKQFENLGVYKWGHIERTARGKDKIMAFVFSDTELFKKPISLKNIKIQFDKSENKKFMLVAPRKIKTETYLALYKFGKDL